MNNENLILDSEENADENQQVEENVGIPKYIASGSHYFSDSRYRFLIMPRYKCDLHSIIKTGRISQKHFLILASQIIDVLMHLHRKHYVHSDIKAENIMIGLCQMKNDKTINLSFEKCSKNGREKNKNTKMTNISSRSHYLRPSRSVTYAIDENSRSTHAQESDDNSASSGDDEDFELSPRKRKARRALNKGKAKRNAGKPTVRTGRKNLFNIPAEPAPLNYDCDDRVYVIDYGLATKFIDTNGEHKPFCMDQRRAHDGTLEFTSRDAHFGAHSRRSDLECLGYNLIYWSQGFLPWKDEKLKEQPEIVHRLKEVFMTDVKEMMKLLYGKDVPRYLGEFMQYVGKLEFDEEPDYAFLKGLFEKEFIKLGFKKFELKLNLHDLRESCDLTKKTSMENELMMSSITDLKTARKLGFLIVTDSVDGIELQANNNESICMNITCKASPKNLRSKQKTKGKRPKRQPKITEKEIISEKIAQGKKLSIAEIATLDPDQIARDRADREYEKFDEKVYYQTPQRYKGNPTYAILEIENKLKSKQGGSAVPFASEEQSIKGYTKPMMDVLKKQQLMYEQQLTPVAAPRTAKDVIKLRKKTTRKASRKARRRSFKTKDQEVEEIQDKDNNEVPACEPQEEEEEEVPEPPRRKRGRPPKQKRIQPRVICNVIEAPDTEEDSVYFIIPGEGSNDGVKDISEDENIPEIKHGSRHVTPSDQESVASVSCRKRGRYYADDDYDVTTDETTNLSTASTASKSSVSMKPRRGRPVLQATSIATRKKTSSRSTSRSAAVFNDASDQSECSELFENESEYQAQSEESGEDEVEEQEIDFDQSETEEEDEEAVSESEMAESNDSNDSIDIKYSPIKTRHARRHYNVKNIRGRLIT